jgi:hypothetical protein
MRPIVRSFAKKYKPGAIVRSFARKYKPCIVRRSREKYKPQRAVLDRPLNEGWKV